MFYLHHGLKNINLIVILQTKFIGYYYKYICIKKFIHIQFYDVLL